MADNYLEKKFDEFFGPDAKKKTVIKRVNQSIDNLLLKNRSYRGYDQSRIITEEELKEIVSVNCRIPSGRNQQCLRFKLVTAEKAFEDVLKNMKLGGALPELHLPYPGTEPQAFIIICSTKPEDRIVDIDLGISMQSMLLKAVDMGLNGIIVCSINKPALKEAFNLPSEPLAILAIGKGAEKIQLLSINESDNHNYYRKNGIHYVPKLSPENLILK